MATKRRSPSYTVLIYAGRGPGGPGSGAKTWGTYSTKSEAQQQKYNAQKEGYKGVKIVKNPSKRKNAPKSRTLTLKGFTGKIRQLANGALTVSGRGRTGGKSNPAKKTHEYTVYVVSGTGRERRGPTYVGTVTGTSKADALSRAGRSGWGDKRYLRVERAG